MPEALNGYQMFKNTDMDEGRGDDVAIPGVFMSLGAAQETAVGRGVYGQPAIIKSVPLFQSKAEYELWEKHSDPEYKLWLKLNAKFGK